MGVPSLKTAGRRAVFLDRDGILNVAVVRQGRPLAPLNLESFRIAQDAAACLGDLKRSGFHLIVVSNQPEVARGRLPRPTVEQMHERLRSALPVDDILVCFHDTRDQCNCRKPQPGLLFEAQAKYSLDLSRSFLIGDRWRDIEAGNAAGTRTVLVDRCYLERGPSSPPAAQVRSLRAAVDWILERQNSEECAYVRTSI